MATLLIKFGLRVNARASHQALKFLHMFVPLNPLNFLDLKITLLLSVSMEPMIYRRLKINISFVPVQKLNKLTSNNHQGIVATISPVSTQNLSDLEKRINKKDPCLILILDGITDTKNFGAILRSSECFGVDYIIISKTGSSPINGETIKSSAGAIFNTPICKVDHIKDAIFFLKEFGVEIIGSDDKASKNLYNYNFKSKTAIILGSEGSGINKSILNICDEKINIHYMVNYRH